jgi:hypothetical protein
MNDVRFLSIQARRSFLMLVCLAIPHLSWAHGGRTDASGCHHDRKHGGSHCHGSRPAPSAPSATKAAQQDAPASLPSDWETPAEAKQPATADAPKTASRIVAADDK